MMTKEQTTIINSLRSQGYGYKRIADRTGISVNTIKSYLRRIDLPVTVASISSDSHFCKNCGAAVQQAVGRKEKKFCSDTEKSKAESKTATLGILKVNACGKPLP